MSRKQAAVQVISRVSGVDPTKIRAEMELVGDLNLDSAKALELLVELEDALGIELADEDAAHLNTVGDIFAFVERLEVTGSEA